MGFPLKSLLILYTKANRQDVYCDYFAGFKALVDCLAPIDIPNIPLTSVFMPLYSYEQQEIAKIVGCPACIVQKLFLEIHLGL